MVNTPIRSPQVTSSAVSTQNDSDGKVTVTACQEAKRAQLRWRERPVHDRLRTVRAIRWAVVDRMESLIDAIEIPERLAAETLAAEIIPLADALRFLEREAPKTLQPRRLGRRGRPFWLHGVDATLTREPWGTILIVAPSNYPLLLPMVQAMQALVAGNSVLIKPGRSSSKIAHGFRQLAVDAGLDPHLMTILPEAPSAVDRAIRDGVDKVILTGSAETGQRVQSQLAERLIPSTMELSGCDAVFVLPSADLDLVSRALVFGLRFNRSATCIAPRRVFVTDAQHDELERHVTQRLARECPEIDVPLSSTNAAAIDAAISQGARLLAGRVEHQHDQAILHGPMLLSDIHGNADLLKQDLFAPVLSLLPVRTMDEAMELDARCPFALGVSIFGEHDEARRVAAQVDAGCVVINDMIAPTADPRIPFGGRKRSGFGVTRGGAGLEEMTQWKVILCQRSRWLPHLERPTPFDADLLRHALKLSHGRRWIDRIRQFGPIMRTVKAQYSWTKSR